jgi:Xaa-Pro aminopeptidase
MQIAIDSAIFPEGTLGSQFDVLAQKALWKNSLNYLISVVSLM